MDYGMDFASVEFQVSVLIISLPENDENVFTPC